MWGGSKEGRRQVNCVGDGGAGGSTGTLKSMMAVVAMTMAWKVGATAVVVAVKRG